MTLDDIGRIVARLETTEVTECVIEHGDERLRIRLARGSESVREAEPVSVRPETVIVKTSTFGTFRRTHPLAVVEQTVGSPVQCGEHLGYLEIDSVLCAIVAPTDGILQRNLLQGGELVGYGQPVAELSIVRVGIQHKF